MAKNLVLIRGDTNKVNIYVRRQVFDPETGKPIIGTDGKFTYTPIDLTGASLTFTARTKGTDVLAFQLTSGGGQIAIVGDPADGKALLTIAPDVTESYTTPTWLKFDVELVEADSTKTTLVRDDLVISQDQTHA
jgi:hypothetical protein